MHAIMPAPSPQLVSAEEVDRFRQVVDIHDEQRFRQLLNELLASKAGNDAYRPRSLEERQAILDSLRARPDAQAREPWQPSPSQIARGRLLALQDFNQAHNLPVQRYAELAGLSRQHIYKLIKARKLLALKLSGHGVRIPDWQLAALPARLTELLLQRAPMVDAWTLYTWLRLPHERFGGQAPIDIVADDNLQDLARNVLGGLGVHA